jgi:DNA end-binding protein Ku
MLARRASIRLTTRGGGVSRYFEDIPELKLPKEMLDLAAHIVDTKSGHFDPSQFEDRYENALIDLLKKKHRPAGC